MSLHSLGAAYGSGSESGSDDDEAGTSATIEKNSDDTSSSAVPTNTQPDGAEQRNFFKTASDSSSDDDDGGHHYNIGRKKTQKNAEKTMPRLPSAFEMLNSATTSSIFQTRQGEEEAASTALLEHHVKLTAAVVKESSKERAPVCRAFKKGRCNKGDRCRFSHVVAGGLRANEVAKKANSDPTDAKFASAAVAYDGWEREEKAKKRRKPGVTNTLLPAKKAMQMFQEQKAQEQPWTSKHK